MDVLTTIESLFDSYSFAKEIILVVLGAVLGGICTTIIAKSILLRHYKVLAIYRTFR